MKKIIINIMYVMLYMTIALYLISPVIIIAVSVVVSPLFLMLFIPYVILISGIYLLGSDENKKNRTNNTDIDDYIYNEQAGADNNRKDNNGNGG